MGLRRVSINWGGVGELSISKQIHLLTGDCECAVASVSGGHIKKGDV